MNIRRLVDSFRYAIAGLGAAFKLEPNFRIQLVIAGVAILATIILEAPVVWLALIFIMTGAVLAAELINTALEHALDAAHPDVSPTVKIAKDCSAAAVLVLSATAVIIFMLMLIAVSDGI